MSGDGPVSPRRWLVAARLVVVLLGADASWRSVELNRVLGAVQSAEHVTECFNSGLSVEFGDEHSSGLSGIGLAMFEDPRGDQWPVHPLRQKTVARMTELRTARQAITDLPVFPWHGPVRDARRAYLAHADAWLAYLDDVSRTPEALWGERPELSTTFRRAEIAARQAVPPVATGGLYLRGRVERLFDAYDRSPGMWGC